MKFDKHNVYFWSDTHFGHNRPFILGPRGFNSVGEHDATLFMRYQKTVPKDATVFMLGDFIFGPNATGRMETILRDMNGARIFLMPGNHMSGWRQLYQQRGGNVWNIGGEKTVQFLSNYEEINVAGQPIVLNHYAQAAWNCSGRAAWQIHGHSHGNLMKTEIGKILYTAKTKDVGVEVCPQPISFLELKKEMDAKPVVSFDHRGEL